MAYYIDDECILCGACEPECPNQAISEGDTKYVITRIGAANALGHFHPPAAQKCAPLMLLIPIPSGESLNRNF